MKINPPDFPRKSEITESKLFKLYILDGDWRVCSQSEKLEDLEKIIKDMPERRYFILAAKTTITIEMSVLKTGGLDES